MAVRSQSPWRTSSVSYRVHIQPKVARALSGFGLARETLIRVHTWLLTELAANPDSHLRERLPPTGLGACYLTMGNAPRRQFFMFAVDRLEETRILEVVACRLTEEGDSAE